MIIDCHTHCDWRDLGGYINRGDGASLVAMAKRLGIDRLTVSSWKAINYSFVEGNDTVLGLMKDHPGTVQGYCVVHPRFGDLTLDEIDRCIVRGGMVGAKLYPCTPRWRADEASAFPMFEKLSKLRVPILIHADPLDPLFSVADRFPEARLIMAHMGGGGAKENIFATIHNSRRYEHLYHDTTTSLLDSCMVEEAVRVLGPERVLFGTDFPVLDPVPQMSKVRSAAITEEQKALVLGGNMERLVSEGRR